MNANYKIIRSIGDGNCLLHSVFQLMDPEYPKITNKGNYIMQMRKDLRVYLKDNIFIKFVYENIEFPKYYFEMLEEDFKYKCEYLDMSFGLLLSYHFNINIIYVTFSKHNIITAITSTVSFTTLIPDAKYILIYYKSRHFEPIEIRGERIFDENHPTIKCLMSIYRGSLFK